MPLFLLLFALTTPPFLQRPSDVVKWSARTVAAAAPGSVAQIRATANVQPGWKLYAIDQPAGGPRPLTFAVAKESGFRLHLERIEAPKASIQKQDENFAVDTKYYEQDVVFVIPVTVPPATQAGTHAIPLEVTFQACGKELCLRPFTQKLSVELTVAR